MASEEYQIETELQQRPPRQVKLRRPIMVLPMWIFLLIFPVVGLGTLLWLSHHIIVQTFGQTTTAHITQWHIIQQSEGGQEFHVDYDYTVGEQTYSATSVVDQEKYQSLPVGAPLQVRYAPWAPGFTPKSSFAEHGLIIWWICGIFFFVLGSGILSSMLRASVQQRPLVVRGIPARGLIQSVVREKDNSDVIFWRVKYQFQPEPVGIAELNPVAGEMKVQERSWQPLAEGDEATVLYLENRPSRNLLYKFCEFQAVPPASADPWRHSAL